MKLIAFLMLGLPLIAQTRSTTVEVDGRSYQVIYMRLSPYLKLPATRADIKVVELNKTPHREWGPNIDTWSIGIRRGYSIESPEHAVKEAIKLYVSERYN